MTEPADTLYVALDWIPQHCVIPDGFDQGQPFELLDWQLKVLANFYDVAPAAKVGQKSTAFRYRRAQVVLPQKAGKGPLAAALTLLEAAGPTVYAGRAEGHETYHCADYGCDCGWSYAYAPGEPMAVPQPTPLIQLLAASEDQVANVLRPLKAMVRIGPLSSQMKEREGFIRVGTEGRIDAVSSSAQSRLGAPITFAILDETGTMTQTNKLVKVVETMRRGLAGMSGRSIETTNAWDPSEGSVAQRTHESTAPDLYRYFPAAPMSLSFKDKRERRRILRHVYAGCAHVDLDAIEAEAVELLSVDPAQAERFFGSRLVAGTGAWINPADWDARCAPREVKPRTRIVLGFDGSDVDDHTVIRAQTLDGYQFTPTYGPSALPCTWDPKLFGGQVPRLEVAAAVDELFARYDVVLMYADPPGWESEVDAWSETYGIKRVIRWHTRRIVQMFDAAERLRTDIGKTGSPFTHDGCPTATLHIGNARTAARPGQRYVLRKPSQTQKIDAAVSSILAHAAMNDVIAAGKATRKTSYFYSA
jgi:phage terminase large subunit-like protein